jgi:hypothetical protein
MGGIPDFNLSIQESTSITSLSLNELSIVELDDATKTVIKERIIEFSIQVSIYSESSNSTLATIVTGSNVMKKVILDALPLSVQDQVKPRYLETLKVVKAACKKKKIELWKENFDTGNGKVDLEK